jgi:hypothetical protein
MELILQFMALYIALLVSVVLASIFESAAALLIADMVCIYHLM